MASELVREGMMTLSQIGELTSFQLHWVYCRPRNQDGTLVREPIGTEAGGKSYGLKPLFFDVWRGRGLTTEQIKERWRDYLKRNKGVARYYREDPNKETEQPVTIDEDIDF